MLSPSIKYRVQLICAWAGFWYIGLILIGWGLIAGFLPPHDPTWSAETVAGVFQESPNRIRAGMVVTMIAAFMCMPFTAALAQYLARIEGKPGVLTYMTLMGGMGNTVLSFYPAIFWLTVAFRPDRAPELMMLLNDWAWLQLIGGVTMFWTMPLAMAVAAIGDRSKDPVFPRWSGYLAIFLFFAILPDQLLFFFKGGPFAWNGILGLWVPLSAFALWFLIASWLMVRALKRGVAPDSPIEAA